MDHRRWMEGDLLGRKNDSSDAPGFTELRPAQGFEGFDDSVMFVIRTIARLLPGSAPFVTRLSREGEVRLIEMSSEAPERGQANLGYIAMPLELSDGSHVGSLCVIDRGYDTAEVRSLLDVMARLLVTAIEREDREQSLRDTNKELRALATTDPLTGLLNRGAFEKSVRREWRLARRHREGEEAYIVIADVDDLKPVNDRLGHLRGDDLLRDVAGALRKATRATDLVGRVGGDEFAVLLVRAGEAGYARFRERFEAALAEASSSFDGPPRVSVGGVPLSSAETWGEALDAADCEMYAEKLRRRQDRVAA
jgi:diguanylate cyclase (GGDEF)-like protein